MADSPFVIPAPPRSRARPWLTIITALVIRDFGVRFRKQNAFVSAFMFLEPIIVITLISSLRIYLFGKVPSFGSSVLLFIGSGVFPFYVFRQSSRGVKSPKSRASEYFFVKPFDFMLSRFLIHEIQIIALLVTFFTILWFCGIPEAAPYAPDKCALSILSLAMLALGMGLINSTIRSYFEGWKAFYKLVSRPMMVFSGAFKTVDFTDEPARTIYTWNPLSHSIELFRWGIYPNYPVASFDGVYLAKWCVGIVVVGIILYNNKAED